MAFDGFETMFFIVFFCIFGIFVVSAIKGLATWNKNNNLPRLTVKASIVAKRAETSHHRHAVGGDISGAQGYHTTSSTTYYVTFEVESTDRIEFEVRGEEYGLLVEEDYGDLSFQGARYLSFIRKI
ncbi:MAG: DUF2500 domain-containing protein [Sarcina sp.]